MGSFLTDNPLASVKEDTFGFETYANILVEVIQETRNLPFCVGIFGPWGAGKTSFMRMIEALLAKSLDTKMIWFDPWKYDKREDLWHALIQSILQAIDEGTIDQNLKDKIKKLTLTTTWAAVKKAVTVFSGGLLTDEDLDQLTTAFAKKDGLLYRHINRFDKDFSDVVKTYVNGGRLVIFIDDLDRCLPENAITVLESLKLFIGNASCVFVLGMDHRVVEEGIRIRYLDKLELNGRDYLDKMIQVPFYLPPVPFKRLRETLLPEDQRTGLSEEIWEIIELGMGGNPRKTKRFLNSFTLLQRILANTAYLGGPQNTPIVLSRHHQDIYFAKLLVFQIAFVKFYQHLQINHGDWMILEKYAMKYSESGQEPNLESLHQLKPFWSDLHLRKFLYGTASSAAIRFPNPPDKRVVGLLLGHVNLVADTGTVASSPETTSVTG